MTIWPACVERLEQRLTQQQFSTWIRPLQSKEEKETLWLLAPNRFVLEWVRNHYLDLIGDLVTEVAGQPAPRVRLEIGSTTPAPAESGRQPTRQEAPAPRPGRSRNRRPCSTW